MAARTPTGWKNAMEMVDDDDEEDEEEEDEDAGELGFPDDDTKRRAVSGRSGGAGRSALPRCQADGCNADLTKARSYHRRHKVCEFHAKAPAVLLTGSEQRFCQQCSRFHLVSEFDDTKRSCRRRLAGHNERRRKSLLDYHGQTSTQ